MKYFTEEYGKFFDELSRNNNKNWMVQNRTRYEAHVKNPFEKFVNYLITEINKENGELKIDAKDCISRINRDIRFSKDKTPYNTHFTAFISEKGKRDKSLPGFFFRITANDIGIMIGAFQPDKNQLYQIRKQLQKSNGQFEKLIYRKEFVEKFGEVKGEIQKRIPPEFKPESEKNFHLTLKQLYFIAELEKKYITSDLLMSTIMSYYRLSAPVNQFLVKAMKAARI